MEDNVYDSYGLEIRLDPKISTKLQASKLLIFKQKEEDKVKSRLLKLKNTSSMRILSIFAEVILSYGQKKSGTTADSSLHLTDKPR